MVTIAAISIWLYKCKQALAAWQADRPDLIRSPRWVLAHVWEGVEG